MILEICGAALLGALTTRFYVDSVYFKSKRRLSIRKLHFGEGEMVFDVAFEGDTWELGGDQLRQLAKIIKEGQDYLSPGPRSGIYLSAGGEKLAAELSRKILPLKESYHAMMAKRPDDWDPEKDPAEVKQFFRNVREVIMFGY